MKLCVECKHFELTGNDGWNSLGRCMRPMYASPVDGVREPRNYSASEERRSINDYWCGPSGIYWEAK